MKAIKIVQFSLLFGVLFLLSTVRFAHANGVYFETTFLPKYDKSNTAVNQGGGSVDASVPQAESGFSYDIRNTLGWTMGAHWMIGVSYNLASSPSQRAATDTTPSLDQKTTSNEYGPTIGYFNKNFRLLGTYFVGGTMKYSDRSVQGDGTVAGDSVYENKGAKGFQVTMGYSFPIGKKFRIGPSLTYRTVTYSKQSLTNAVTPALNYTDQDFTTKATVANFLPMISLILAF